MLEHRDRRAVKRDRAVAFVDLADEQVGIADQRARRRARRARRNSSSPRRSSPSGCDRHAWRIQPIMPVTVDLPEVPPTATLVAAALSSSASSCGRVRWGRPSSLRADDVGNGRFDRRRGDQRHARREAAAVLREEGDAHALRDNRTWRASRPASSARSDPATVAAAGADDAGEGQHPAAADAAEEGAGRGHGRPPYCGRGEVCNGSSAP